ncbi:MAG: hypothetical protein MMC23_005198 [Stictis urceolatum]|nr:hypothetical protein [Stictis urceolata]
MFKRALFYDKGDSAVKEIEQGPHPKRSRFGPPQVETFAQFAADLKSAAHSLTSAFKQAGGEASTPRDPAAFVALHVTVAQDDLPNTDEWSTWLDTNMPSDLRAISIDTLWRARPTILVVTMPVELWRLLPRRPAYFFIAHVRGLGAQLQEPTLEDVPSSSRPGVGKDSPSGQGRRFEGVCLSRRTNNGS